ncbi:glycosyltransferase [Polynucleobacter sp. MWH-UH24A]|uniref:glycosyltransferase n=1 Tax=Polynucleobacter sp. MWH-UH24A TaxID=2689110 RepID=UPI001BFD694E|nr:glycosyltransferase [Polynucleobacter sp. MWH-UH24A]QWD76429.1 glycosyltransferase [Polynucleobacter sp. MWH-UH24A]
MKILVILPQIETLGGIERLSLDLYHSFRNMGISSDLLCLHPSSQNYSENCSARGFAININEIIRLKMPVSPNLFDVLITIYRLRKFILTGCYDVVETGHLSSTFITSFAIIFSKVRHVVGIHYVYKKNNDNSLKLFLYALLIKYFSWKVYCVSEYTKKMWCEYSSMKRDKIHVVHNAISDKFFLNSDSLLFNDNFGLSLSTKILLFVGRHDSEKGFEVIWDSLKNDLINLDLAIFYVGDVNLFDIIGTKRLEKLKREVENSQLKERVHFLGPRNDIHNLMALSYMLIHPTRREAFGMVIAEAMAIGIPVISTDVDGLSSLYSGSSIEWIPPNDVEKLRIAVFKYLNLSTDARNGIIKKNKDFVLRFQMHDRVNRILKLMSLEEFS